MLHELEYDSRRPSWISLWILLILLFDLHLVYLMMPFVVNSGFVIRKYIKKDILQSWNHFRNVGHLGSSCMSIKQLDSTSFYLNLNSICFSGHFELLTSIQAWIASFWRYMWTWVRFLSAILDFPLYITDMTI